MAGKTDLAKLTYNKKNSNKFLAQLGFLLYKYILN